MNQNAAAIPEVRQSTLAIVRAGQAVSRIAARSAFWRTIGMVRPHRVAMIWGMVLGLGVALTYAASLGGVLPVLKVVVDQHNLHAWLLEQAAKRGEVAAGALGAVLTTVAGLFPPPLPGGAADTPQMRMQTLLVLLAALLLVNIVGNVLRVFSQYLVLYASNRTVMDLRRKMYRKALHAPLVEVAGDVSNRVSQFMSDAREVYLGIVTLFGKVAREPLKAVCVLAVAIAIDARLTLIVLAIAPVAIGLLWYFGRKVRKAATRLLQGYGVMLGSLEESLQGIDTVKGYAREGHERRRMWQLERRMLQHQNKLGWIEAISSPAIELVGVLIASAGIIWLASRTFAGEIDASQFGVMVILLTAMLDPVRKVANVYNVVQRSGAAAQRIFEFLDRPDERSARTAVARTFDAAPAVAFERVSYRYSLGAPAAVDAVSLEVEPGECVALVGPNGSGKSTLLKLLPRLLTPESGRILLDGTDAAQIRLRSLREQIAIVSQRPTIFARSVHENLAYGCPGATREQTRAAAERAFAAEFIEQLPQGYDTVLGEFGTSLSGGQRQRLAIARAFLKPARVLIFDEATSEIDAESESRIHAALNVLRAGRTTFLIAHRHTVMDMADRIVVMDAARIVDSGRHAELIDRCPLYVALYRSPGAH